MTLRMLPCLFMVLLPVTTVATSNCPAIDTTSKTLEFTNDYDNSMDCNWNIQAPDGMHIRVNMTFVHTESLADYVEIDKLQFSGNMISLSAASPCVLVSDSSEVSITFHSDMSVSRPGFSFSYSYVNPGCQESDCPAKDIYPSGTTACTTPEASTTTLPPYTPTTMQRYYTSPTRRSTAPTTTQRSTSPTTTQRSTSPQKNVSLACPEVNYSTLMLNMAGYNANMNCYWELEGEHDQVIAVSFISFDLEMFDELVLNVTGHNGELYTLTGSLNSTSCLFISTTNIIQLRFSSDESDQRAGFQLNFVFMPASENVPMVACPELYMNDSEHISTTTPSGTPPPSPSGNHSEACGGKIVRNAAVIGDIKSPSFPAAYPNNMDCEWEIEAAPGKELRFSIIRFDVESAPSCMYDTLLVTLGEGDTVSMCNMMPKDDCCHLVSPTNRVKLNFHSDGSETRGGFWVTYEEVEAGEYHFSCDSYGLLTGEDVPNPGTTPGTAAPPQYDCGPEVLMTESSATITSPLFPEHYPNNAECTWRIQPAQAGEKIAILVRVLELEARYDNLILIIENEEYMLSGEVYNFHQVYDNSDSGLELMFVSDGSVVTNGFELEYALFNETGSPAPLLPPHTDIDCRNSGIQKIVGGEEAEKNSWPWQIMMRVDGAQQCGGSIVDRNWILTASHCVDGVSADMLTITGGEHTLGEYEGEEQTVLVAEIIMHENYDSATTDNDIALLRLAQPMSYSTAIRPVCLGTVPEPGATCFSTGWGNTEGTGDDRVLNEVELPLITNQQCDEYLGSAGDYSTTDNMFCAGREEGGVDTCQGDSGGPFVCSAGPDLWSLVGVVSWGLGCAEPERPGVYARVDVYQDWISDKTNGDVAFI